jgi:hypothetical protein
MARNDGSWGGAIALVLRDCEPEARLEFMRSLGMWQRISQDTVSREDSHEGDRLAAESRLIKLQALQEHLDREMESDARWRAMFTDIYRRLG